MLTPCKQARRCRFVPSYQPCPRDPMGQSMTGTVSAPSPPRHSSLFPSHAVWSICTYYSPRNFPLSRNPSPRAAAAPIPDVYFAPVPTRYTTKRDPKHQRCFSEKNMAKRKQKATKNPNSNFEPLVQFTFKNRNLDLPCFGWDGFLPAISPPAPVGLTRAEAFLLARDVVHFSIKVLEKAAPKTRRSGKVSGSPRITSFSSTSLWHIAVENQESPHILVLSLSPMFICSSPTNHTTYIKMIFNTASLLLKVFLSPPTWPNKVVLSTQSATTVASSHVKHAREHAKLLRWW